MENQQAMQNCHIILGLCAVGKGECLLTHKACQEKSEAGNVTKERSANQREFSRLLKRKRGDEGVINMDNEPI